MMPDPTTPTDLIVDGVLTAEEADSVMVRRYLPTGNKLNSDIGGRAMPPTVLVMSGMIALLGGGPFVANDDLDRRLIEVASATEVVVLPTADAFEHPSRSIDAASEWGDRLGVSIDGRLVLRRADANTDAHAHAVEHARMVYLVGDSPLHLRSVLKGTALFDALKTVLANGGV